MFLKLLKVLLTFGGADTSVLIGASHKLLVPQVTRGEAIVEGWGEW